MRRLLFKVTFKSSLKLGFAFALLACSQVALADLSAMSAIFHETPSLEHFNICWGGGCETVSLVSISAAEWQPVADIFTQNSSSLIADTAEQERNHIALAIGMLETIVGVKTGTSEDKAGTFDNSAYSGQLDCNDEATNSTTYMRLLQQAGFIKLHAIEDSRTRNFFFTGWPHTAAVIRETKTGERYAVDSWFYDNGHPATIVPFTLWKSGYKPADSPIGKTHLVKN